MRGNPGFNHIGLAVKPLRHPGLLSAVSFVWRRYIDFLTIAVLA